MTTTANRIEITVTAKEDADVRRIGERIKQSVESGARDASAKIERELGEGAREAGQRMGTELGKAGEKAGDQFSKSFSAKAQPRDQSGRFTKSGELAGAAMAAGAARTFLRDAKGKFASAGSAAGAAGGERAGRSFVGRIVGAIGGAARRVGYTFGLKMGNAAGEAGVRGGRKAVTGFANVFEDGITSPMLLVPLIAAAAAAAPLAGAALATGVVFAFGAGLAGLGLVAASKLKGVQKQMKSFKKFMSGFMKDIGKPMVGAFTSMLSNARRVLKGFEPVLKKAFKVNINPAMERFFTNLGTAFKNLEPAIKPLSKAFADLMDALGPKLPGIFEQISNAIIAIANTISSNPDLFANIITGLLELIPLALNIANALAKAYAAFSKFIGSKDMWQNLLDILSPINALMDHLGGAKKIFDDIGGFFKGLGKMKVPKMSLGSLGITDNASKVIDKVKGNLKALGKKVWRAVLAAKNNITATVNNAKKLLKRFAGASYRAVLRAKNNVAATVANAKKLAQRFARATYRAVLRAKNSIGGAVASAKKLARSFANAAYRATLRARSAVGGAVSAARNACRRFARASYRAVLSATNAVWNAVQSAINMGRNWASRVFTATLNVVKSFSPFEHGGVVGGGMATGGVARAASGGNRGASVLVGEHGPEMVNLPGGSRVRSNPDTRRLLSQGGGGGVMVVELRIGEKALGDIIIDPLRKTVRAKGGDVQAVLGSR